MGLGRAQAVGHRLVVDLREQPLDELGRGFVERPRRRPVWIPLDACSDLDTIMALLAPFGDQPVIVKDYVKSRKHEWFEACYIPSAADRQAVARVVRRFLELQGDDISEGLVFRAYRKLVRRSLSPGRVCA